MQSEFDRIILAVDGSEYAKKAARKALFIAKQCHVPVDLICVLDPLRYSYSHELFTSLKTMNRQQAMKIISEIETIGEDVGVIMKSRLIDGGTPFEEIIKSASERDLIVLGSKGKTGVERVFLGSVSEKVTRHAPCSVLIVR